MTQPTCDLCGRPLPDQGFVDERCTELLRRDLLRIVDLAPEVEVTVAKLVKFGGQQVGGGSGERPLPWNESAAARSAAIGNAVATWARHVSESRGRPVTQERWSGTFGPLCYHGEALPYLDRDKLPCPHWSCDQIRLRRPLTGVALAAAWLAQRDQLKWLRHQPEAALAFRELGTAARRLEGLVGRPPELRYRGPCWAELGDVDEAGEELRCQEILYVRTDALEATCRSCGAVHDVEHRRDWLLSEARSTLAHAELIARALMALGIEDITSGRVRGMARHGRLVAHGTDQAGRPMYRVGEVLDVIDEQTRADNERAAKREARAREKAERASRASVA